MLIEIKAFNDEESEVMPVQLRRAGTVTWWHSITKIGVEHGYFYRVEIFVPVASRGASVPTLAGTGSGPTGRAT